MSLILTSVLSQDSTKRSAVGIEKIHGRLFWGDEVSELGVHSGFVFELRSQQGSKIFRVCVSRLQNLTTATLVLSPFNKLILVFRPVSVTLDVGLQNQTFGSTPKWSASVCQTWSATAVSSCLISAGAITQIFRTNHAWIAFAHLQL